MLAAIAALVPPEIGVRFFGIVLLQYSQPRHVDWPPPKRSGLQLPES
jgi:hypothetical protein